MTTYYKVLAEDGSAFHGGSGKWHLPTGKRPGKWMPMIDNLEACRRGYHVCERQDVIQWIGPAIFEVEIRGETIRHDDKTVAQGARLIRPLRWDRWAAILWSADCAERSLQREKDAGRWDDERSWNAIHVARQVGRREIDPSGPRSAAKLAAAAEAARSAAAAEARSAARSAAWSAWSAWSASAPRSAWAAWSEARSAARSAAWSAAAAEARSAARSAAAAEARSAARSAAWSAWSAWSAWAAWAAWSAARSAAEKAEREWQTNRLFDYLEGRA